MLAAGHNPYDSQQLEAASHRYAPDGYVVGSPAQPEIHLPATLAAFALFSWPPSPCSA